MPRHRILLTFGGRSGEHDVSIISASNILPFFGPERHEVEKAFFVLGGGECAV